MSVAGEEVMDSGRNHLLVVESEVGGQKEFE